MRGTSIIVRMLENDYFARKLRHRGNDQVVLGHSFAEHWFNRPKEPIANDPELVLLNPGDRYIQVVRRFDSDNRFEGGQVKVRLGITDGVFEAIFRYGPSGEFTGGSMQLPGVDPVRYDGFGKLTADSRDVAAMISIPETVKAPALPMVDAFGFVGKHSVSWDSGVVLQQMRVSTTKLLA